MDIDLFNELQEDMPVFDQDILDGLAVKGLADAKKEVDLLIACAEKAYPEGFEFVESKVISPQRAYTVMSSLLTRSDRSDPSIDLALSDVFLVEYQFACNGVKLIPRYLYLPYVRRGGLITITGKQFAINAVLSDPGLSIGPDYVFIRFNRAPVTFKQDLYAVRIDGDEISEYLAYSWLHNRGGINNKTNQSDTVVLGRVLATLPHYLFCRYGLEEAFRKFARTDIEITRHHVDMPDERDPRVIHEAVRAELKEQGYDLRKYTVFTSAQNRPSGLKTKVVYKTIASNVVLLIPTQNVDKLSTSFARAFFYMIDHYPEIPEGLSFEEYVEELKDAERWKIWMGYLQFGDQYGRSKIVENVNSHLTSLDAYVDIEAKRNLLEEEGLEVDDIYELFRFILVNIETLINNKEDDIGSMYGKRLQTSQYVLRDITAHIFKCLFEITNNKKRKHTAEDYNKILGKYFMPTIIFNLRKTSTKAFMSSVSTPGDNMYPKITSRLVMQAQTSNGRKPSNLNVNDPLSRLHPSIAEAGNYATLPKNMPLGRTTLNPTTRLDSKNTILRKEHMVPIIDHIDDAIHRN